MRTVSLLFLLCAAAWAQNPTASVIVDVNANRHSIDPRIYGIAYGTTTQLSDLNVPLNRYGGNNTSRYNWQLNADNRGQDWYFESIPEASALPGERGDTFISTTQAGGARPMITIPMLDWVGKLGANRAKLASFSQAKYGAQAGNDAQWFPDAGNGILKSNGQNVTGNDPNDANVANTSAFQQQWVQAIVNKWGQASLGAPRYYVLDNEHSIWHSTHRDVHPSPTSYDEVRDRTVAWGSAVKAADPSAKTLGPSVWGWTAYFWSALDWSAGGSWWNSPQDRLAHGDVPFLRWYLRQMRAHEQTTGTRILDYLDVHYYPQASGVSLSPTSSAFAQDHLISTPRKR